MIKRIIADKLGQYAKQYPVITITGPRQSGKTTLGRMQFPDKTYLNLELPDVRAFAQSDPRAFLNRIPDGAIIDEIQRVPDLVSYIQGMVDEKQQPGMFILTGSQQFELTNSINQSLAGRTALLRLLPFSMAELKSTYSNLDTDSLLFTGFYPRIYDKNLDPVQAQADYIATYVERDIRQLIQIKDLSVFQRFIKLCAGRSGQLLNLNNLAADTGVSHTTIREWITLLEASYIIFLLQPYHANIRKRLVKTPKLYFYDVGIMAHLLGIETRDQIMTHPLRGSLFENLVISEIIKHRFNASRNINLNFYRDSTGHEIDIIYHVADKILPIEIKSSQTFSNSFLESFYKLNTVIDSFPYGKMIVYNGDFEQNIQDIQISNLFNFISKIEQLIPS